MTLRPGAYAKYKAAHDELWPELAAGMRTNQRCFRPILGWRLVQPRAARHSQRRAHVGLILVDAGCSP